MANLSVRSLSCCLHMLEDTQAPIVLLTVGSETGAVAVRFSACPFRALAVPKRLCPVSSLPPQNRACGSPAHGVPPSSRHVAFRRATGVGDVPQSPSLRNVVGAGEQPLGNPACLGPGRHTRLAALRSGAVLLSAPSALLRPPPTPAPLSPVSQVRCFSARLCPS